MSYRYLSTGVIVLVALSLIAVSGTRAQDASIERLKQELPRLMEAGNVPGLSIAVLREGQIAWAGTFGVKSLDTGEPVNAQTVFQAASLSKPVFAFAVLRLAERGAFDLDAPLADYLPYERLAHEPRSKQITARMVLSHSTGLPNWGGEQLDLAFDPGTQFSYSGEGFVYLQKTLEHLTGLTLDELVQREVFEPLEMSHSSFVWQDAFEGHAVSGHDAQGHAAPPRQRTEGNAAASLVTTAADYARFLGAIARGEGLRPETRDAMLTPQLTVETAPWGEDAEAKRRIAWGLGVGLMEKEAGGFRFWHWGDNGTHKAYTVMDPQTGMGFVYFANSTDGLSIARAVTRHLFDGTVWPLRWLDYEQHDDPARVVRLDLYRAFAENGVEVGTRRYEALRAEQMEVVDESLVNQLGYALLGSNHVDEAIAVFTMNVSAYPESSNVYDSLGEAYLAAGEYGRALANYRKSVELNPDNENGERHITWIEDRMAAMRHPVTVPVETLRRYVGDYGPRHVTIDGGVLYYQRDGNPRYRLVPISQDTFALDGLETFRIRFVVGEDGAPAVKIVGLYVNGDQDETPRDGVSTEG